MATSLRPTPSQSRAEPVRQGAEVAAYELWRLHENQRHDNSPAAPLEALLDDVRHRYPTLDPTTLADGVTLFLNALFAECAQRVSTHRLIGEFLIGRLGTPVPEIAHFSRDARKRYTGRTPKARAPLFSPRATDRTGRPATN